MLGESRVIRSSYIWLFLVPFLARLLEPAASPITVSFFDADIRIALALPFSLTSFYAAAVLFSVASVCFQSFCPDPIKMYKSFSDFERTGKGVDVILNSFCLLYQKPLLFWPLEFSDKMKAYFFRSFLPTVDPDLLVRGSDLRPVEVVGGDIAKEKIPQAFWFVINNFNRSKPIARLMTSLLYLGGFVALALVLLQNCITVWRVAAAS